MRRGRKSSPSVNPRARLQFPEDDDDEQNRFLIVIMTAPGPQLCGSDFMFDLLLIHTSSSV